MVHRLWRSLSGAAKTGGATAAIALASVGGVALAQAVAGQLDPAREALPGHAVYDQNCAACHNNAEAMRAPAFSTLRSMAPEQIRFALTQGVMKQQGSGLSNEQREQVIAYLAKQQTAANPDAWVEPLRCAADKRAVDLGGARTLTAAGGDPTNSRHLSAAASGLTNAKLGRLEVAWTLALPQTTALRVTPVIVGSTMFYAAPSLGTVMALDTRTGCVKWSRKIAAQLRSSPTFGDVAKGRPALVIADAIGILHALDPKDGAEIWKADPRHDTQVPITGAPIFYQNRIVVPISAMDVAKAADPKYKCCVSHGAVAVVDAADGRVIWTAHTMEAAKALGRKSSTGQELWGPSGAPIWSTPAVDVKRGLVYVGTGENTSPPATPTSDSIMAVDLKTGARKWVFQASKNDIWNMACRGLTNSGPNCPWTEAESIRRDFDFGAGPILVNGPGGRSVVLAGQKSGQVYGLDPDDGGKVLWTQKFGKGTALGGVHWGMASDGQRLFAPISDPIQKPGDAGSPGLNALDVLTGKVLWQVAAKPDCEGGRAERLINCRTRYGFSAAPMVVDHAVITGSIDGWLRIYDAADGRLLYSFDTARDFPAGKGVAAKGGAIDAQSIAAGDGMVFVGSGYGQFAQTPGNVLIAFRPQAGQRAAR